MRMAFSKDLSYPIEIKGHAWVLIASNLACKTCEEDEWGNKSFHFRSRTVTQLDAQVVIADSWKTESDDFGSQDVESIYTSFPWKLDPTIEHNVFRKRAPSMRNGRW